jgi:hypothetical protein
MQIDREGILKQITELSETHPPGWQAETARLSDAWAKLQGLPRHEGSHGGNSRDAVPERRAREHGYSYQEISIVGRWLEGLLETCPSPEDANDLWIAAHVIAYLANPEKPQAELAAKLGFSQQYLSRLVVRTAQRLPAFSRT